jgi:8-oxo-dGTP diphosphatase
MTFKKTTTTHHDGLTSAVEVDARDDWSFRVESNYIPGECQERVSGTMESKERAEQAVDVLQRMMRDEPVTDPVVRVGVAVWIFKDDKVLMGKRMGSHGSGTWSLPGGHVDFGESPVDTVTRETAEETGLTVGRVEPSVDFPYGHKAFPADNKQYITLFFVAEYLGGEPELLEPDKCERWDWFSLDALPSPLFGALEDGAVVTAMRQANG